MHPIETIHFRAEWTDENRHLQKEPSGCCDCKEWLGSLVGKYVTPSAYISEEDRQKVHGFWEQLVTRISTHRTYLLDLMAPNGTRIQGAFYRSVQAPMDSPTLFFFMPNALLSQTLPLFYSELFSEGPPHHIVSFDYNQASRVQDLLLAADTVYQCVSEWISENNLIYMGRSLGGGAAALHRHMRPSQAPLISMHSFSSLEDLIIETDIFDQIQDLSWIEKVLLFLFQWSMGCLKTILVWLLRYTEWDFSGVPAALQSIGPNAHVIVDRQDELIQGATAANCVPACQVIEVESAIQSEDSRHNMFLKDLRDKQGVPLINRIVQFIPPPSAHP